MAGPNPPVYDEKAGLDPPPYEGVSVLPAYDEKTELEPPTQVKSDGIAYGGAPPERMEIDRADGSIPILGYLEG